MEVMLHTSAFKKKQTSQKKQKLQTKLTKSSQSAQSQKKTIKMEAKKSQVSGPGKKLSQVLDKTTKNKIQNANITNSDEENL